MKKPVIGITLDSEPPGGYSKLPWYALRENYVGAVRRAGGLPILLPHEPEEAEAYLERIDGLVVTGGAFDIDPARKHIMLEGLDDIATTLKSDSAIASFESKVQAERPWL